MATIKQQQKILKARVAVALYDILGRVPKDKEVDHAFILTRVICKALGLHPKA